MKFISYEETDFGMLQVGVMPEADGTQTVTAGTFYFPVLQLGGHCRAGGVLEQHAHPHRRR